MNRKYLLKRIAQDCIPTVFSLLMSGLYGVMDGLFVGRAVGDAGLAAINIAWPIAAVITAVGIGIGSGGSVLYSNSNGKGEQERGELVYHQTITLLFAAAMVLLIVLGFTYPAILSALGAKGDVYQKAVEYIQIIIFGAVFQVMGTGFIPMLRNRNLAFQAMVCRDGSQWGIELSVIICCKNRNPGSGSWDNCCTVCCVGDQFLSYLRQAESTSQGSVAT